MFQRLGWCKFIVAVVICAPIACSEQLLPQLVAQIASLDGDHGVSLHANDDCVDLILTHKDHASPKNDEGPGLMLSASEAAHVVHIATGSTTAQTIAAAGGQQYARCGSVFFDNRCFSVADICSAPTDRLLASAARRDIDLPP